jgi:adenylate cyclase class 2
MAQTGHIEVEIKLAMPGAAFARRLLRKAGFRARRRRALESNLIFDTAEGSLRRTGRLLRLRCWGGWWWLTFKGPPVAGPHKRREELEVRIDDGAAVSAILERLGLASSYCYEKYRAEYQRTGERGTVALDETPIGVYLELEGSPAWIDRAARRLGFGPADYVLSSYATLYGEHCQRAGLSPGQGMVFATSGKRRGRLVSTGKKST